MGTRLITLPAISRVHWVECAPWNVARPSGSVISLVEVVTISGQRKLFHESMNVSAEQLRENLRDSGRTVSFRGEVAKLKASRWLNEHVTYVDPEGVEIDRALLSPDESDETDA